MKQISITTVNGIVNYTLANGAPLPSIKAGNLIFHAKTSGLQSIPLAQLVEYEVESVSAGTKSDRLKAALAESLAYLDELRAQVHEHANASTDPEDAAFGGALDAYAEAIAEHNERREKAEKFFERRAETERKRAAGETRTRAKKAAPVAPVETTPTPRAKRAKK